ncbi:MAG: YggU family protein [Desulfobacteraceae bacterium IS3]|nr:MAG: YggU family protein [Desulfobacteraceae bacterium IS3]
MLFIQESPEGLIFKIFVQPRSSKNAIAGLYGDAIKIRLTAPPVDNAANEMCIKYLSKCLGIPKSAIEIASGHTGRTKQILLRYGKDKVSAPEKEELKSAIMSLLNF